MAGRSMSRCASTAAAVADVFTASTCSTPFSASPNAPCAHAGPLSTAPMQTRRTCRACGSPLCRAAKPAQSVLCPMHAHPTKPRLELAPCRPCNHAESIANTLGAAVSASQASAVCCMHWQHFSPQTLHCAGGTLSARSMPIFMVPAEEGHVPHAPCTTHPAAPLSVRLQGLVHYGPQWQQGI